MLLVEQERKRVQGKREKNVNRTCSRVESREEVGMSGVVQLERLAERTAPEKDGKKEKQG